MARATKSEHVGMRMHRVEVRSVRQLSPRLRRITLGSESLRRFVDDGPDQRFKLLLPRPHQHEPVLPDEQDWYADWRRTPDDVRAVLRTYTIRSARPDAGEVDVDVVVHGSGPGSSWAATARAGDTVGLFGAYAEYEAAGTDRHLLIGDYCALPAIAAILERLDPTAVGSVLIELDDPADRIDLDAPAGVELSWVETTRRPGDAARRALEQLSGPFDYAWVAGERAAVSELRRQLLHDRGLRPEQIMFMGYWRADGAIDDLD